MEIWKDITGYEGLYMVSNTGLVRSLKTNKILSLNRLTVDGYLRVALFKEGKAKEMRVNRIVAMEFIPNPENKETVNHINGIKTDNRVENLEWSTKSEQMKHAYKLGLKKPMRGCKVLTKKEIKEIKETYKRYKKGFGSVTLAKKYGVESSTILRVVNSHYD